MSKAIDGSYEDSRLFFEEFLKGPLYVPERYQSPQIENSAPYPNDFINILGLQKEEQIFVPVFSSQELISSWCGRTLNFKTVSGQALLELIPAGWWVCVNPGCEVEKEMSPWELDELRAGQSGIEAILEELFQTNSLGTLSIRELQQDEFKDSLLALKSFAQTNPQIKKLFAAVQEAEDLDLLPMQNKPANTLLIGAILDCDSIEIIEKTRQELEALAEKSLIGAEKARVFAAKEAQNVALSIFKEIPTFYQSPRTSSPAIRWFSCLWKSIAKKV